MYRIRRRFQAEFLGQWFFRCWRVIEHFYAPLAGCRATAREGPKLLHPLDLCARITFIRWGIIGERRAPFAFSSCPVNTGYAASPMVRSQKNACHVRPRRRALLAVQIVLAVITGLLALRVWSIDGGQVWKLLAGLSACTTAALIFRLGWLVPCIVLGTLAGILLDPAIKGGTIESQMWETVSYICFGAVAGFVVGLMIDMDRTSSRMENGNDANDA